MHLNIVWIFRLVFQQLLLPNFICGHEVDDEVVWVGGDDPHKAGLDDGEDEQYPGWNEEEPSQRRDNIASAMWVDYQGELARRVAAGQVA